MEKSRTPCVNRRKPKPYGIDHNGFVPAPSQVMCAHNSGSRRFKQIAERMPDDIYAANNALEEVAALPFDMTAF